MNETNELLAIAQIAVALAGFSVVAAAFLQDGGLHPVDRVRFAAIFSTAFAALALAFVPILLDHLGISGSRLWSISSFVMLAIVFVAFGAWLPVHRGVASALAMESSLPTLTLLVPGIVNLVLQIGNVGGWLWQPSFVTYLIGLLIPLYITGVLFVHVVLYRPRTGS